MSSGGKRGRAFARLARHLVVVIAACLLVVVSREATPAAVAAAPPGPPAPSPSGISSSAAIVVVAASHHALVRYEIGANTDLRTPSGLTTGAIDQFLAGSALAGLGSVFIDAEQRQHVNARYLVAHAIEESAWGSSLIAQEKHNLYGYGAVDWNPYGGAQGFPDFATAIEFQAQMVARDYLRPGGAHWGGAPTLNGMHRHYATDPRWVQRILDVAALIPG